MDYEMEEKLTSEYEYLREAIKEQESKLIEFFETSFQEQLSKQNYDAAYDIAMRVPLSLARLDLVYRLRQHKAMYGK